MGKKLDLIGQRFGSGVVIAEADKSTDGRNQRRWLLKCNCGNDYYATTHGLRVGDKKSCGCRYSPDLTGQTFNGGMVVGPGGYRHNRKVWIVKCKCGNEYLVTTDHLKDGHTQSCGCLAHKPEWGMITARAWNEIKQNAKRRRKIFKITKEYAWKLFQNQNGKCALTGVPIEFAKTNLSHKVDRNTTASLDRIDSSKGYIEDNVQWVHKYINSMKNAHTTKEFINWCELVTRYNKVEG